MAAWETRFIDHAHNRHQFFRWTWALDEAFHYRIEDTTCAGKQNENRFQSEAQRPEDSSHANGNRCEDFGEADLRNSEHEVVEPAVPLPLQPVRNKCITGKKLCVARDEGEEDRARKDPQVKRQKDGAARNSMTTGYRTLRGKALCLRYYRHHILLDDIGNGW